MGETERRGPPRIAEALCVRGLPEEIAEAVAGDLEEDHRRVRVARGRLVADLWYWGQVLRLRRGALRRAARRLRAVRPTWERSRPRPSGHPPSPSTRMSMIIRDLEYALRHFLKSPGFTLVAVLSLALGIGANTAVFSLVNAVLLRDLPVSDPDRVVEIYTSDSDGYPYSTSSYPDYSDLKEGTDVFEGVVGTRTFLARMERGAGPELAFGELISWDYFQVLGVSMAMGRSLLPEEDATPGGHPVTILGYRAWVDLFGADPEILGSVVHLNGRPYTVVGVAPQAFPGTMPVLATTFFAPLSMTDELMALGSPGQLANRGSRSMFLKGRLREGVTVEQANEALAALSAGLAAVHPESNENRAMSALPMGDVSLHPFVDRMLLPVAGLLLVVVGVVLLIACANLASFLLARAEDRRKEIAVRLALGAGRGALVRQLLVEATLLAAMGGLAAIGLAYWALELLRTFEPPIPIPMDVVVELDGTVLAFTAGISVLAGMLFGLAPALQATDPDVASTLKDEGTGGRAAGRFRLRNALVVVQVAFSFVLLIGAGLFVRSLQKAQLIDPGFYTGEAALVWPMPQLSGYETAEEQAVLARTLEQRLLSHPLIDAVAMTDRIPLGAGVQSRGYVLPGVPSTAPDGEWSIDNATVMPGYFEAMDVRIVDGRAFSRDDLEGEGVVVVSEALVRRFYPGEDVIGRLLGVGEERTARIVGVAEDTKVRTLGEAPRPYVYEVQNGAGLIGMEYVVRGQASSEELLSAALGVLDEVDPDLVLFEAKTMNEHLALMLFPPRMAALLLAVFGGLALTLSAIGIYGVVSYSVAKRTRELGIRMSLGASGGDVVRMAVGGGMRLVLIGAAAGVVLSGAVTWTLAGFLYEIGTRDVVTFGAIPLLLCAVALLAAVVPARRASSVDPVTALRSE